MYRASSPAYVIDMFSHLTKKIHHLQRFLRAQPSTNSKIFITLYGWYMYVHVIFIVNNNAPFKAASNKVSAYIT